MTTALWIIQVILAIIFIVAGLIKVTQPVNALLKNMSWVNDYNAGFIKFIGICEFSGGVGLILPVLLDITPVLTPIAATCLCIIMLMAGIYHANKKQLPALVVNIIFFAMAAFVAYERFKQLYPQI